MFFSPRLFFGVLYVYRYKKRSTRKIFFFAPVAQLDRALPSGGKGQGFESLRAYHTFIDTKESVEENQACLSVVRVP